MVFYQHSSIIPLYKINSPPRYQNNTKIDTELTKDRIEVMKKQEENTYFCHGHSFQTRCRPYKSISSLKGNDRTSPVGIDELEEDLRQSLCVWCYRVVDFLKIDREVVTMAFSMLDRFLEHADCDKRHFRLAAITSLYLAVNMMDSSLLSMDDLAYITGDTIKKKHIMKMEILILRVLSWR